VLLGLVYETPCTDESRCGAPMPQDFQNQSACKFFMRTSFT
jgi:hypothetical protein